MNEAQFLLSLGMKPKSRRGGFPCPALIDLDNQYREGSALIETREEVDAFVASNKSLADRIIPKGRPWAKWV